MFHINRPQVNVAGQLNTNKGLHNLIGYRVCRLHLCNNDLFNLPF